MATGVEASIEEGLLARLATLTLSPVMPVSEPNIDFKPVASGYLQAQHFPVDTNQVNLGSNGKNRTSGIFQVSVYWPTGEGAIEPKERASLIAAHFKRGTVITQDGLNIRIVEPPHVAGVITEKQFLQVPVSINYLVDADNPA